MAGKSASIMVKILGDESGLRRALSGAESKLQSFSDKTKNVGTSMMKTGAVMTAGITAPLALFAKQSVDAFMEAEKASAQLDASLKSTGATSWATKGHMDDLASSMQKKLGIDDDLITSGQSLLLTFTNVQNKMGEGNDIFDRTTQMAADMSTKLGMDLPAANMLLGKALNDPIKGMGTLRKAGVQLTEAQQEQVKAFMESGDVLSAQKIILGELENQFEGSAEAAGNTSAGKMEKMKLQFEDIQESIGERLIPILSKLGGWLEKGLVWWDSLGEKGQNIVLIMAGVAAAIGPVVGVIGALVTAIGFLISPVGLVVLAIAALVAGFVWLYKSNDGFRKWVDGVVDAISTGLGVAFAWIKDVAIPALAAAFQWFVDNVVPHLITAFQWVKEKVVPILSEVATFIGTFITQSIALFRQLVEWLTPVWFFLWDTIQAVVQRVWPMISGIIDAALGFIRGIIQTVTALIKGDWSGVWEGIKSVLASIWNGMVALIGGALGILRSIVGAAASWIGDRLGGVWSWISNAASSAVSNIVTAVSSVPGKLLGVVGSILGAAQRIGSSILEGIGSGLSGAVSWVGDLGGKIWNAVKGGINSGLDRVRNFGVDVPLLGRITPFSGLPRLARGGLADLAGLYTVGERGPETVMLPRGARVTPNHMGGGAGGGVNVYVTSPSDPYAIASEVAWAMRTSGR